MRTTLMKSGLLKLSSAALLALATFTSHTGAQTQPSDGRGPDGGNSAGMNGGSGYDNGYSDYPSNEVNAVPPARANAVRARLEQELVQRNLHRWIDRTWDDFENSKEYLDATAAERKAQDDYNRERDRVLAKLKNDSNYRTLQSLVKDVSEQIERDRPRGKSGDYDANEHMLALATVKLGYSTQITAMESAALAADNGISDSRGKLTDAGNRSREMRRGFNRTVRREPEFLAARARLDEAQINRVVASAYLESVVNARSIALHYAYYVHRWDQYKYSTGTYNYPYYGNGGYGRFTTGGYLRRY